MTRPRLPLTVRVRGTRGQTMVFVAVSLMALLSLGAFAIDIGRVLQARRLLQMSSDAAATAAAMDLSNNLPPATASATAIAYSSLPGQRNASANVPGVTMVTGYPLVKCTNYINNLILGSNCTNATTPPNTVVVKQQVNVQMSLARAFGLPSIRLEATATAGMRSGGARPFDVIIILDTTQSMDNDCSASVPGVSDPSRLDCAKAGVRALLAAMLPCQSTTTCGPATNGHVANPLDEVGLAVFPGLLPSSMSKQFDCSQNIQFRSGSRSCGAAGVKPIRSDPDSNPSDIIPYGCLTPTPSYIVKGLSSDYKTSMTSGLNPASHLVQAVDWTAQGCKSSSFGLEAAGGVGSYFAGAIAEAQSILVSTGRPNVQKAIIFVSDGDAGADSDYVGSSLRNNQCQQAITAADNAAAAGTWVYSIAYGASTSSSSCSTDSGLSAYQTMVGIASDSTKFFNQPNSASLTQIFQYIAASLTTTRLLDDNVQ